MSDSTFINTFWEKVAKRVGYELELNDWNLYIDNDLEWKLRPSWNNYFKGWKGLREKYGLRKALILAGIPAEKLEKMDWVTHDIYRLWLALGHPASMTELKEEYGEAWVEQMNTLFGSLYNATTFAGKVQDFGVDTKMHDYRYNRKMVVELIQTRFNRTGKVPDEFELNQLAPWWDYFSGYEICVEKCIAEPFTILGLA